MSNAKDRRDLRRQLADMTQAYEAAMMREKTLRDELNDNRRNRVYAQRGLVVNYELAQMFADELRENGLDRWADRMVSIGLNRPIGYDPDKDPAVLADIQAGRIPPNVRTTGEFHVKDIVRQMAG